VRRRRRRPLAAAAAVFALFRIVCVSQLNHDSKPRYSQPFSFLNPHSSTSSTGACAAGRRRPK
jgi:hypothetical protein